MTKKFNLLKQKRQAKRTNVTKIINKLKGNLDDFDNPEKIEYMEYLLDLQSQIDNLNEEYVGAMVDQKCSNDTISAEHEKCADYELEIVAMIAELKSSTAKGSQQETQTTNHNNNRLHLPQIPLPHFGNRPGEDLNKFLNNFEQIINKHNLTEYEKYIYLQKQLSNEPKTLIGSLELGEQNYTSAKDLLTKAFACQVTQQYNAIGRLSKLKFNNGDDPYVFISTMRQIIEAFKVQNIDTDLVLQFFIWNSLSNEMKTQFVHITNNNKPTLDEIKDNIYIATERFLSCSKKSKFPEYDQSNSAAANINNQQNKAANVDNRHFCTLCSTDNIKETSHATYACPKYPNVQDKLKRIDEMGGCAKCGFLNHVSSKCRYKFKKKCENCNKHHYSYLCKLKISHTEQHASNNVSMSSVYMGKIIVEANGKDCIIPTFSKRFIDGSVIRGMRDSGCQANFITNEAAKRLQLKIVEQDYYVAINGFNATEKFKTNIVELNLQINQPPLRAICVPTIRTKLSLPGLEKVVNSFIAKGFNLADEFLSDSDDQIQDLDMVLGNSDAQLLPVKEVLFGQFPKSIYCESAEGVLLSGSVQRLVKNLHHLPKFHKKVKNKSMKKKKTNPEPKEKSSKHNNSLCNKSTSTISTEYHDVYHNEVAVDPIGHIDESVLNKALNDVTKNHIQNLYYDTEINPDETNELDEKLNSYVLQNIERDESGRLVVPLLWNHRMSHLLAKNYNLSRSVLISNKNRLQKSPEYFKLYDEVLKSHLHDGIIEQIGNVNLYLEEHPNSSFIPHMGVFKMKNESTKCRIVLLSNLVEKNNAVSISHNQAMVSGANLNDKITTALTKLRFDKYLITSDLVKAFLNVGIRDIDQDKLLILWFKNVSKGDFTITAYKYKRLPFGLRPSPTLLMLCLYHILIVDNKEDSTDLKNLKQCIYDLSYMDNLAFTSNDIENISSAFKQFEDIFNPYQFALQQWVTNCLEVQDKINTSTDIQSTPEQVKLLGLLYDRMEDSIATEPMRLNKLANSKREVLSTIASNYDALQINAPLLNRARLYIHKLQCRTDLEWDDKLSSDERKAWRNICQQINNTPSLSVNRCFGKRTGEFELIAFTDASKTMLGTVIYIKDKSNNKVTFLKSTTRMVTKQLETKSIPTLELHSLHLGVKLLMDINSELTGIKSINPINIKKLSIYCDSMVALTWVNSYANKLDKVKRTAFVVNRLESISRLCESFPVSFNFIAGNQNPSDVLTRPISYNLLNKTCYLTGPNFITDTEDEFEGEDTFQFMVPNKLAKATDEFEVHCKVSSIDGDERKTHLITPAKYSNFYKLIRVHTNVLKFIYKLKTKVGKNKSDLFNTSVNSSMPTFVNAFKSIIRREQECTFPELIKYFDSGSKIRKEIPNLIMQLNVFRDEDKLLRVRSKFKQWRANPQQEYPLLLSQHSELTKVIVFNLHTRFNHAGVYSVINQIRKEFFIPQIYSYTKRWIKTCSVCTRLNERAVKLNQAPYRQFRESPPEIPFRSIFMDYFGPYYVKMDNNKVKRWVLCITCLWSRAINLKVVCDMTTKEFLRGMQLHIFEYGLPETVLSDLGTNMVAGAKIIADVLKDQESQCFFEEYNMRVTKFQHYFKGNSSLGSLVESCVKLSKRLIYGCIKNNILSDIEFNLVIAQTVHLVNKRPVAFANYLRDTSNQVEVPETITLEILLRGFDTPSLDIIPFVRSEGTDDNWTKGGDLEELKFSSEKLSKVRHNLRKIYHEEFLSELVQQAVSEKDRFKPVKHNKLKINDIVLLKEEHLKAIKYPMGIIVKTILNDLDEVTNVHIKKGNGEIVLRHVTSVIPYLSLDNNEQINVNFENPIAASNENNPRSKRVSAILSERKTKELIQENKV